MTNVLFKKEYSASCSCGWQYPYWAGFEKVKGQIENHRNYCNKEIEVDEL